MGGFDLIERFFKRPAAATANTVLGIGDDCALLQPAPGMTLAISCGILHWGLSKTPMPRGGMTTTRFLPTTEPGGLFAC